MAIDKQSEMYQLTINNPDKENLTHEVIKKILINNFKTLVYFCMADEKGSCLHTHVFICCSSRVRFSMVKRHFPTAHIESVKGTVSENIAYIKKSGKWETDLKHETQISGTFDEYGTPPPDSKGKSEEMTELYNMVIDGLTNAEIIAINQDYILHIDKLDKLRTTILTDRYKNTRRLDIEVVYCYGVTGAGKTRSVLDEFGDSNVFRVTDYQHPFDGYNCQEVIVFDEFRSSLPLKDMLNYCDIYPIELCARYSNKYACYNKVFIISNWKLERQYAELRKDDLESWRAFLRRIHKIKIYKKDEVIEFDSVEEYFNRSYNDHPTVKFDF